MFDIIMQLHVYIWLLKGDLSLEDKNYTTLKIALLIFCLSFKLKCQHSTILGIYFIDSVVATTQSPCIQHGPCFCMDKYNVYFQLSEQTRGQDHRLVN